MFLILGKARSPYLRGEGGGSAGFCGYRINRNELVKSVEIWHDLVKLVKDRSALLGIGTLVKHRNGSVSQNTGYGNDFHNWTCDRGGIGSL